MMIQDSTPMDQEEIIQTIALLRREPWVQTVTFPGTQAQEISVLTRDGQSWRITRPIHLVRLKCQYQNPQQTHDLPSSDIHLSPRSGEDLDAMFGDPD